MAFLAIIPHFVVFSGFLGPPGPFGAGVLHQPPAGAPGRPGGPSEASGRPRGPREGSGTRSPGSRRGLRDSPRGPLGPGEAWDPVPGVPDAVARGVLHQPLAATARSRESGILTPFSGFWPFLAKIGVFAPVATGGFS